MQVGCSGVARVADTGEDLPALNPVSDAYLDAPRLEMRVQGKPSIAQIEDNMVTICFLERDAGRQGARHLIRKPVHCTYHHSIGHGKYFLSIGEVVLDVFWISHKQPVLVVQSFPINGKALRQV
jgi:hypothetical protein